jgi:MFS family permease
VGVAAHPYRSLLGTPGLPRLLAAATVARMPIAMGGLAILLLVREHGDSYAIAGLATGAYALGMALCAPLIGRLIDARGQRAVLVPTALVGAAALVLLALAAPRGGALALVAASALAGAATPPVGACLRSLWTPLLGDAALTQSAFSLDSTIQELIYLTGPLLVVAIGTASGAASAVLATGALLAVGTLWFVSAPASRRAVGTGARRHASLGPLQSRGLRLLLASAALLTLGLGATAVAVPAFAEHAGNRAAAGPLLALWAVGSMAGGLAYGARTWHGDAARRLVILLVLATATTAALAAANGLVALGALLVLAGVAIAPTMACLSVLVDRLAAEGAVTEAFAWLGSVFAGGSALGEALSGTVVTGAGTAAAFLLAAVATGAAAIVAQAAGTAGASAGSLSTPSATSRSAVSSRAL